MNKRIIFVIGAAIGGGLGSVITWNLLKTKYEEIAKEEISQVKEAYKQRDETLRKSTSQNASVTHQEARRAILGTEDDKNIDEDEKSVIMANKRSEGHTEYNKISPVKPDEIKETKGEIRLKPYIISLDEFEASEYDRIELHYYSDGILTDDEDEPLNSYELFEDLDIENGFDPDSDEPDLLFIRNPKLKLDYEIQRILLDRPLSWGTEEDD